MRLNLGCGDKHIPYYVNIDKNPSCCPDLVLNLGHEFLPFDDNSIDAVVGEQFLEHLDSDELSFLFTELHRVCKNKCCMFFVSPYMYSAVNGLLEHKKLISEYTFATLDWVDLKYDIKFGLFWYKLKGVFPVPYLIPSSIELKLVVNKKNG